MVERKFAHRLLILATLVVLCGLAAHLAADASAGLPDLGLAGHRLGGPKSSRSDMGACDLLAALALPVMPSVLSLWALFSWLHTSELTQNAWRSARAIHPPRSIAPVPLLS